MLRSDFDFHLPPHLIAQRPPARRGESRLMTVPPTGAPRIGPFTEIVERFRGDEVLVVNDTRVVPARVFGRKPTGGAVEVLITEPLTTAPEALIDGVRVHAMVRGKRLRPGVHIELPGGVVAELVARGADRLVELCVRGLDGAEQDPVAALWAWLDAAGRVPLPPYIDREPDDEDRERYQTVFAREPGAVAAPTAGLHFTPGVLDALRTKGVTVAAITLHVGPGTFLPVTTDNVEDHPMHAERFVVPPETAALVSGTRPVVAVGTTAVRALEAHARDPEARQTDLFIRPGFDWRVVDGLITNFHLPQSTLLMLVSALVGRARVLTAYADAVAAEMRFYSYGDAMLLRRGDGRWT